MLLLKRRGAPLRQMTDAINAESHQFHIQSSKGRWLVTWGTNVMGHPASGLCSVLFWVRASHTFENERWSLTMPDTYTGFFNCFVKQEYFVSVRKMMRYLYREIRMAEKTHKGFKA